MSRSYQEVDIQSAIELAERGEHELAGKLLVVGKQEGAISTPYEDLFSGLTKDKKDLAAFIKHKMTLSKGGTVENLTLENVNLIIGVLMSVITRKESMLKKMKK